MSYTVPPLSTLVILPGGYTVPGQAVPVVLGLETGGDTAGTLLIALPAPTLPLTLIARERPITAALTVSLPAPAPAFSLAATADVIHAPALAIALPVTVPDLALTAAAALDLALVEDTGPRLTARQHQALPIPVGLHTPQQAMIPALSGCRTFTTTADPIRVGADVLQQAMQPIRIPLTGPHTHGLPLRIGITAPQTETLQTRRPLVVRQADGLPVNQGATATQAETIKTRHRLAVQEQGAVAVAHWLRVFEQPAQPTAAGLRIRWQHGLKPAPGRWWPHYEAPPLAGMVLCQKTYTLRPLACPVLLSWEPVQQPHCPGVDPVLIPIQEVYLVINTFSLVRADTGQAVDALDFDATLTADSWCWSWSANIPAAQMSRVRSPALGEFVELIATVNGTAIRVLVESLSRSRKFGSAALSVSGRGRAAWLADPHSLIQTTMSTQTRTAQQLLNDALMVNGVSIGWAVTWNVEDWSVPAGLWSHTGTYIEAATRIATSAGGYVQAHDTDQTLIVKPYYPLAPWAWAAATPDLILPEAVCTTEGIDWQDSPAYNAVWVTGAANGRRDKVKRAGTAADRHAPTVVDPLATDPVMTRQRGLRVLADTGRQAQIKVSLPVLAETGLIKPGALVSYTEQGETHIGLSRAISVRWQFPTASQTVTLETHELEPV